jgi:hypothetical protein
VSGGCPLTWAAAQDGANWTPMCGQISGVTLTHCTNVDIATIDTSIETATVYQYDLATGALFNVEMEGRSDQCTAGSATVACSSPKPFLTLDCMSP